MPGIHVKRRRLAALAATAALGCLAAPSAAQFAPPISPDANIVSGVVVNGYGGPAWWIVSDEDTKIYVLASPGLPVPKWDQVLLNRRLAGANEVVLPPDGNDALGALTPAMQSANLQMNIRGGGGLEAALPRDLRTRFRAARERIRQPATRYGLLKPALAGFMLAGDITARERSRPAPGATVEETVETAARQVKIAVRPVVTYGRLEFANVGRELDPLGLDCLAATLDELETASAEADDIAAQRSAITTAWTKGNVSPLLEAVRAGEFRAAIFMQARIYSNGGWDHVYLSIAAPTCVAQIPTFKRVSDDWIERQTQALLTALHKPGKAVAVLHAEDLLFEGGIFDQLRKRGVQVTTPDGTE